MATGRVLKRNGKWAYVISLSYDPIKGKYPQKWRSGFETKKAAQEALIMDLTKLEDELKAPSLTVSEYLALWLEQSIKGKRAPNTERNYRNSINNYINKAFGDLPLDQLAPKHIENLYTELTTRLSSSSVHTVHRTLRAALNRAVKLEYLKTSPMTRVDVPSLHTGRRSTLSPQQAKLLMGWMKDHYPVSYIGIYLAVFTGMRRGEICGLQWRDIEWEKNSILILRTRQRIGGEQIIGKPKTDLSSRSIPVSEGVINFLKSWKAKREARVGEELHPEDWLLTQLEGFPIDPDTLTHDLHKAEKALNLPLVSFHDLRHTHATIMLEAGVDLKTVSERLGHSSIRVTGDVYAHVTNKMHKEAVERLERAFEVDSDEINL